MNFKMKMMIFGLIGGMSSVIAQESGNEINLNNGNTRIFKNIAITATTTGSNELAKKYQVIINTLNTKINTHPENFSEIVKPVTQTIDRKLWIITADQLPLTLHDCMTLNLSFREKDDKFCYKYCLLDADPEIIAFDQKNKKVYLNYGSTDIGTGGGPSILFVADINTKKIKLLRSITLGEKGSISPASRYLVLYGTSVLSVYNTEINTWFDINKSENNYSGKKYIIHSLYLKKWISDTQFTYLDNVYYFTSRTEPQPFISAKEYTYDIATKIRFGEKSISEMEYNEILKDLRNQ